MRQNPLKTILAGRSEFAAGGKLSDEDERLLMTAHASERDGLHAAIVADDFAGMVRAFVRSDVRQRADRRREEDRNATES